MKSGSSDNGEGLSPSDCALLLHLGHYHLTFREALTATLFKDGKDPGNALAALARQGYLKDKAAPSKKKKAKAPADEEPLKFPGGKRYYILGPKGASLLGLPKERTYFPKPAAMYSNLAVLWHCTMEANRSYRLSGKEVRELFPKKPPHHNTIHCITDEDAAPVVYRAYVSASEAKAILKEAKRLIVAALENSSLRPFVVNGEYGLALLVETAQKRDRLREMLQNPPKRQAGLAEMARIKVEIGPSPQTLNIALRSLKKSE